MYVITIYIMMSILLLCAVFMASYMLITQRKLHREELYNRKERVRMMLLREKGCIFVDGDGRVGVIVTINCNDINIERLVSIGIVSLHMFIVGDTVCVNYIRGTGHISVLEVIDNDVTLNKYEHEYSILVDRLITGGYR